MMTRLRISSVLVSVVFGALFIVSAASAEQSRLIFLVIQTILCSLSVLLILVVQKWQSRIQLRMGMVCGLDPIGEFLRHGLLQFQLRLV